jgi:hypothetical protein
MLALSSERIAPAQPTLANDARSSELKKARL